MNEFFSPSFRQFAAYDCDAYGAGTYNADQVCTQSTGTNSGSTSTLPETGTNVIIGIGLGVLLIVIAIAILFRSKLAQRK